MEKAIEKLMDYNINTIEETIKNCGKIYSILLKKYKLALSDLNSLEISLSNKWAERYSYYKCDYDIQLTQQEIKSFIENDLETSQLRFQIKEKMSEIKVIEGHLKNIDSVRWDIKTLLEYKKLEKTLI